MGTLPQVGAAGIAAVLATIIWYLLNANRQDRKEHRADRLEWDARFKAQQDRHDKQLKALQDRLDKLDNDLRDARLRADLAESRLVAAGLMGGADT
jgi:uncharacterized protein YaaR (DUF327 family)